MALSICTAYLPQYSNLVTSYADSSEAEEVIANGTCGTNLSWKIVSNGTDDYTLNIQGTGEMNSYTEDETPWYSQRYEISSVTLPDGLTSIGEYSFCGLINATTINVPDSVNTIGKGAFKDCYNLQSTTIPDGVTSIEDETYYYCEKLAEVSIPNSVTSIGESAFFECSSLKSVNLSNYITTIGDYAFKRCYELQSIDLPDGITTIGNDAFTFCSSLSSMVFPNSVTSLGYCVLLGCSSLTEVVLPNSIEEIQGYSSEDGFFTDCTSLESITIPDSVTDLGTATFKGCTALKSIHLGSNLDTIEYHSFRDCTSLTDLYVNSNITNCYSNTLEEISTPITLHVGENVTELYTYLNYMDTISNIELNPSITNYTIVDDALYSKDGTSLEYCFNNSPNFTIASNTVDIKPYAFNSVLLSDIETITIPDTVNIIQYGAFNNLSNVKEYIVQSGNSYYKSVDGAIYDTSNDTLVRYPNQAEGTASIEDGTTAIEEYAFRGCNISDITIPDSITTIGSSAFMECQYLQNVTLNDSLQYIDYQCFKDCLNLKSIVIPKSIDTIYYKAFDGCDALKSVIFLGDAPTFNTPVFSSKILNVYYSSEAKGWEDIDTSNVFPESTQFHDLAQLGSSDTLSITPNTLEVKAGETYQLKAEINPAISPILEWSSSDNTIATVSDDGMVTALKSGEVTIQVVSSDGKSKAECSVTVTGTIAQEDYNEYDVQKDVYLKYTTAENEYLQIPCEPLQGVYILNDDVLYFHSLVSNTDSIVNTFKDCQSAYYYDNTLYVLCNRDGNAYVLCYDLINRTEVSSYSLTGHTGTAIGVDTSNRVFVATDDDGKYGISLYDNGFQSEATIDSKVYNFCGFNSTTGDFYLEVEYSNSRALKVGNVSKDLTITTQDGILNININEDGYETSKDMILTSNTYLTHKYNVQLLNNEYLAICDNPNNKLFVLKSDTIDYTNHTADVKMNLSRDILGNNDFFSNYDLYSIGTKTLYNSDNDSFIVSTDDDTITEYSASTGEALSTYSPKHSVFNMLNYQDKVLLIEKSEDQYYMELLNWKSPTETTIVAESDTITQGQSQTLSIKTNSLLTQNYKWSSSDNSIASVSEDGKVVGWHEGSADITATSLDGKTTTTYTIKVLADSNVPTTPTNIVSTLNGVMSNNVSDNNYGTYGSVVRSYVAENSDGTFTRVEYISDTGVVVETYSKDYSLISTKTIEPELSYFGGFYSGKDYNFLVFGQSNSDEKDDYEVVRVVKYSKDWERIGACSITGSNTTVPFNAGSLRMTETNGKLYIHTCHTMYTSSDGLNHQANMLFVVNQDTLALEQSFYDVMNIGWGYVSHSFNQYIQTDGEYVYRVDHGDAYPRAVSITRFKADGKVTDVTYTLPLNIFGEVGDNYTGVSVGGFELSPERCVIVGNSVDQSSAEAYSNSNKRNIFVTITDKELQNSNVIWLTKYSESDTINPYTPQIVKFGDSQYLIMWEEYNDDYTYSSTKIVTIDDDGNLTSEIMDTTLRLSDCKPILNSSGLINWYVTDGDKVNMYSINPYDLESIKDNTTKALLGDVNDDGKVSTADLITLKKYLLGVIDDTSINTTNADINVDNRVSTADLVMLKKYLLGIIEL